DANGKMLEVEGPGVVGELPVIAEGETFRYQSGVPLDTPFGVMEGSYTLQDESGQPFEAPIAPFTLAVPNIIN
ncbi:ApaG domain-containing protein, partial [Klebsiella pneumoniae]